jgi:short-subunit dehydrogenase
MALPNPSPDTTVLSPAPRRASARRSPRDRPLGHNVTLVARRKEKLEALAKTLRAEHGVEVDVHPADLSRDRARAKLLRDLTSGRDVVGVCNNAGIGAFGHVLSHDVAEEETMFRTNALALFDLTNHLVRPMVERGEGAVLNTGSILAVRADPAERDVRGDQGVHRLVLRGAAHRAAGHRRLVHHRQPGPTRTPIFDSSGAPGAAGFGPGLFWQDASDVAEAGVAGMLAGRRSVTPD